MKSVIRFAYRKDYTQKREPRIRVNTIIRQVKNIKLVEKTKSPPPFYPEESHKCYQDKTWRLYKGEAIYRKKVLEVFGWTFNDHIPLFWGCDTVEFRGADYSLWGWYSISDSPKLNRYVEILHQPAARAISKHLGARALNNYLSG